MKFFKKNKYPKHLEEESENISLGKQILIFGWEFVKVVVISLAIIVPVRYFLITPFYVKGASMEPNFHDYEYLIIDEISYRLDEPQRGDIVVFRYPMVPSQYFIKRLIGLPGEKIKISGGQVHIYDINSDQYVVLEEDYLPPGTETVGSAEITLAEDEYYLLGDNRPLSLDSRAFGPVKRNYIIGKVFWRGWPLNRIGFLFSDPEYNL